MVSKLFKFFGVVALTFILTSGSAFAQGSRGEILVINDWNDAAHVTLLMERHDEMIKTSWDIEAGDRTYLGRENGQRIRVSARDRIKVKDNARPVAIGDVGRFRDGAWHVRVRDVYQAQRGRERDFERNTDRPGSDYENFDLRSADPALCQQACEKDSECRAWTYVRPNTVQGPNPRCWLKNAVPEATENSCCISGVR